MTFAEIMAALDEQIEIEQNITAAEFSGELTHEQAEELREALSVN